VLAGKVELYGIFGYSLTTFRIMLMVPVAQIKGAAVMRTALYARLSRDWASESENVEIQKAEGAEYADGKGWEVVGTFGDNDISASRYSTKPRPGYLALLASIRAGAVEAVLVTEMPRLYRRLEELLELIRLAETTPLRHIEAIDGSGYDLSTGEGIHNAVSAVNNAALESRKISDRAKRKKKAQAKNGAFAGGTRPYGYEADGVTVREAEAAVIRWAASELLAGRGLRSLVAELNRTGRKTAKGHAWRPLNLRRILTSKRIVGVRVHNGAEHPAVWPAILDVETWERLQLVLNAEARMVGANRKGGRSYLLTGMIFCGRCGGEGQAKATMIGYGKRDHGDLQPRRRYYCRATDDRGVQVGCGKVTRLAEPVEALVSEAVLDVLDSPRMAEMLGALMRNEEMGELTSAYQDRKLKLDDLVADYASGLLNREQLAQAKSVVEDAMEDLRRRMDKLSSGRALAALPVGRSIRDAWGAADLEWRRSLVNLVIERVVLQPGRPGAHRWPADGSDLATRLGQQWRFDPLKVEIVWRV
jgi:site-specific DNA recombinase